MVGANIEAVSHLWWYGDGGITTNPIMFIRKGKWKGCKEGSQQEWVILELESMASINYLDIGNHGAAFIEVKVGNFTLLFSIKKSGILTIIINEAAVPVVVEKLHNYVGIHNTTHNFSYLYSVVTSGKN